MRRMMLVALVVVYVTTGIEAQWFNHPTPRIPRTPEGKPDLSGPAPRTVDGVIDLSGQWRAVAGKYLINALADMAPDQVPFLPAAAATYEARMAKDDPAVRCLPLGIPRSLNSPFRIVQSPDVVAVLLELGTRFRQIFTDGRPLPVNPNPAWYGYSVGRWEGDVFHVESSGFTDRTWLDAYGHPHSESLRVVERFHRKSFGAMDVQVTIEDPQTYTRPWTFSHSVTFVADTDMLETICDNNDQILPRLIGTDLSHPPTRRSVAVTMEVLRQYPGRYQVVGGAIVGVAAVAVGGEMTVRLAGEGLEIAFPGNPEWYPMFAEAPDRFFLSVGGSILLFERDAEGRVTGVVNQFSLGHTNARRLP